MDARGDLICPSLAHEHYVRAVPAGGRAVRLPFRRRGELRNGGTDIDSFRQHHLGRAGERGISTAGWERVFSEAPVRSTMPVYSGLLVDLEGNVWVRDYLPEPAPATSWQVFDPEGRWLGAVELIAGLEVTEIGPDYVLGVLRDDYEVEYVRLHRLVKPPV
jgi:hypothetical protein